VITYWINIATMKKYIMYSLYSNAEIFTAMEVSIGGEKTRFQPHLGQFDQGEAGDAESKSR
jgi:hypothetical protein